MQRRDKIILQRIIYEIDIAFEMMEDVYNTVIIDFLDLKELLENIL